MLAGCSSSDGGGDKPDADSRASGSNASSGSTKDVDHGCKAEVKAIGQVRTSWGGDARATEVADTGQAVYQARQAKDWIAVYSKTEDEPAKALVTVKGVTYTATGKGIDVESDGSGATVDARAAGPSGKGPQLVATFTCK